jgi:Na+/H+-dicarboxylate symporter
MTTTIIAVVIGIIIVIIIHPGKGTKENMYREGKIVQVTAADAFLDLIRYVLASPPLGMFCSLNLLWEDGQTLEEVSN